MSGRTVETTRGAEPARWATVLACTGVWALIVPYLATALGLDLDVPPSTEVVDHVVPGVIVVGLSVVLGRDTNRERTAPGELKWLIASAAAFLAGFWITSTHVPLLIEAPEGISPWGASLMHLSAGPPVALVAARMLLLRR